MINFNAIVKKSSLGEVLVNFEYDGLDRLIEVNIPEKLGAIYSYDSFNRRISKYISYLNNSLCRTISKYISYFNNASAVLEGACIAEGVQKNQLLLHSDNGSPMKGATMLATLQKLGVIPSFSSPSVSNDTPYSESLFRTLKYSSIYPEKPFESLYEAREWVNKFVSWYNCQHLHSGIKFITPEQRHN